jgi:hypothetical protein
MYRCGTPAKRRISSEAIIPLSILISEIEDYIAAASVE